MLALASMASANTLYECTMADGKPVSVADRDFVSGKEVQCKLKTKITAPVSLKFTSDSHVGPSFHLSIQHLIIDPIDLLYSI